MSPYFDKTFISFFGVLALRVYHFFTGQLQWIDLASDEIQLLVLIGVGISSALVGSLLILRQMTMLANSLSHTILLGIVMAFLLGSSAKDMHEGHLDISYLLISALAVGFLTAFTTESLIKITKLQEDASTGLVFSSFFAIGIILVTLLTRNAHVGAEVVMGNIDALHPDDLKLAGIILSLNLIALIVLFKEWKITTFDPQFAKALGYSPYFFNYLLMALVSLTVVGAFRAVGVLMVLTFLTAPALFARLFCNRLSTMLTMACAISIVSACAGVALSRHLLTVYGLALSTGGIVVALLGTTYLLAAWIKK
jgi:manganese/zinc/iron transport system permease protein